MERTGFADLPLHSGGVPRWLFERMKLLGREIVLLIIRDFGPAELLRRLADPFWFQSLGCLLGFDWHSSGLTTTLCAALKEAVRGLEEEIGFFVAGGKGKASRRTPDEIARRGEALSCDPQELIYASRMAAKVDTAAVQDGYDIYHHAFFFTADGKWAVVQQGMNPRTRYARRYHWLGEKVRDFVCEPQAAICAERREKRVLNLVARESERARLLIPKIASEEHPQKLLREIKGIAKEVRKLRLPEGHAIPGEEEFDPAKLEKTLWLLKEKKPEDFAALLSLPGVGPKTVRALSLIAEVVYGAPPSFEDPARYSFAHGGKDGHPYPVDRRTYDESIELLSLLLARARIPESEKREAFRRLKKIQEGGRR